MLTDAKIRQIAEEEIALLPNLDRRPSQFVVPVVLSACERTARRVLTEETALLREVAEAARRLSEHSHKLTKIENYTPDGNHLAIHADWMLDLEGITKILDAALSKLSASEREGRHEPAERGRGDDRRDRIE